MKINSGFNPNGAFPVDNREVFGTESDLYVKPQNVTSHRLYNRAYKGLKLSVFVDRTDGVEGQQEARMLILNDATPYMPGSEITVNAENFDFYWTVVGSFVERHIEHIISPELDDIRERIGIIDSSIFIGDIPFKTSNTEDSNEKMITDIGNMKAGTTIEQLEAMTVSDVLKKILFEVAIATKKSDLAASVSWKSSYKTEQEVGANLPEINNINVSFSPETWHCVASNGEEVATYQLNQYNASETKFYHNTTNSNTGGTDMSTTAYDELKNQKVVAGTRYIYANVAFSAKDDAYDTDGATKRADKYAGTKLTTTISYTGLWHVYTNAPAKYSSASVAWSNKNDRPSTAFNENDKNEYDFSFAKAGSKIYVQWPDAVPDGQNFTIYVPTERTLVSVMQADPNIENKFTARLAVKSNPATVSFGNRHNATHTYKAYQIDRAAQALGIVTVEITLS